MQNIIKNKFNLFFEDNIKLSIFLALVVVFLEIIKSTLYNWYLTSYFSENHRFTYSSFPYEIANSFNYLIGVLLFCGSLFYLVKKIKRPGTLILFGILYFSLTTIFYLLLSFYQSYSLSYDILIKYYLVDFLVILIFLAIVEFILNGKKHQPIKNEIVIFSLIFISYSFRYLYYLITDPDIKSCINILLTIAITAALYCYINKKTTTSIGQDFALNANDLIDAVNDSEDDIEKLINIKNINSNKPNTSNHSGKAIACLVFGILAIIFSLTIILGFLFAIISFVFGFIVKNNTTKQEQGSSKTTIGFICSCVAIAISTFALILYGELLFSILFYIFL